MLENFNRFIVLPLYNIYYMQFEFLIFVLFRYFRRLYSNDEIKLFPRIFLMCCACSAYFYFMWEGGGKGYFIFSSSIFLISYTFVRRFFTYLIRIRFAVTACTESGYYVFFLNSFLRKENNFQLGSSLFPGLSFDNSISIFLCLHRKRRMWHLVGDSLEVFAFGAHAY